METIFILLLFLIVGLIIKVPAIFALALGPVAALLYMGDFPIATIPQKIYETINSFPLMAIPFFVMVGVVLNRTKLADQLLDVAQDLLGHLKGGLIYVNVLASMVFAGMSGAALADIAGIGRVEIHIMIKAGYRKGFAAGLVSASSLIGPIIPPSIAFVIFGAMTGTSVADLFIAGIIPGGLMAVSLAGYSRFSESVHLPEPLPRKSIRQISRSFFVSLPVLLLPVLLLGGITAGIFTPTEAACVAIVYAIFLSLIYRKLGAKDIWEILKETIYGSGEIMVLTGVAVLFGYVIALEQIPQMLAEMVTTLTQNPILILILFNIVVLAGGCFMDNIPLMLILIPTFAPLMEAAGVPFIQWGVVLVVGSYIGLLTPPVGLCVYAVAKVAEMPLHEAIKETFPFIIPLMIVLILLSIFPELSLWLPGLF